MSAISESVIEELIQRAVANASQSRSAEAARTFNALPLYEGWFGWALLLSNGNVVEADEFGNITLAEDPLRTMYLVGGAEKYPELEPMLPTRSCDSMACSSCNGTGWMHLGGEQMKVRCAPCRALGWVESPSGTSPECAREG